MPIVPDNLPDDPTALKNIIAVMAQDGLTAQAEIAVDHVDIRLMPAELARAVLQRVLQAKALLVCQHLMRGGLSNVNHRPPPEMVRFDEFRAHRSSPGGRRRDPPRPADASLPAGFARHRRA